MDRRELSVPARGPGLRRTVLPVGLILVLIVAPAVAEAQRAVPRIGYLCTFPCGGPRYQAFVESLEALGYVNGRSITLVYPAYPVTEPQSLDRLPAVAAELVRQRVDVIFAAGDAFAARAAKQATPTIPIVMAVSGDPVKLGIVASLARPGGNVTGITYVEDELILKHIELLKDVVPTLSRVGALVDGADPASFQSVARLDAAAKSLGLQFDAVHVRAPTNFEEEFATLRRRGSQGLVVMFSPNHYLQRSRIAALAIRHHLVAVASFSEFAAEARGLLAYRPKVPDLFQRAAHLIDRILRGARPSELPVEQPTRFSLVVNLGAARDLGLTIPPSVLARADEIIHP